MKQWSTSCLDWERRIVAREPLIPPPIFPEEAEAALAVFKELRIVDIPGKPKMGDVCEQWIFDYVAAIFGAYDADTGKRLIRKSLLLISKKNAKSTIAAGIMLTALIRNWRDFAESFILAPTKEVADNSFLPAKGMVKEDDELDNLFHVQDHIRKITHRGNDAFLKIIAADSDTVSGKKGSFVLIDELHEFGKKPNAEEMLREATGGQVSRDEGFVIMLTTFSEHAPTGVFEKELNYARKVRDGLIEDKKYLPVLYEWPKSLKDSKSYELPENFYVTNPNLGRSVSREWLEDKYKEEKEKGLESLNGFLAKHLNVEVGLVMRSQRWAGADFWRQQASSVTLEHLLDRSEVVVIGIDGGGLDDLLGLAVLGRDSETRDWLLWTRAWVHPIALERRKIEAARYRDFQRDGDLVIVDDIGQDIEQVGKIVMQCEESGLLDRVGVDPVGIGDVVDEIEALGIEHDRVVGISQGWRMSGAIKTAERKLAEGTLIHGGQRMMEWCVGNARVEPKGNAILITKQASGSGKIDPLMATLNAVALMAMNPEARGGRSVYEDRGVLIL